MTVAPEHQGTSQERNANGKKHRTNIDKTDDTLITVLRSALKVFTLQKPEVYEYGFLKE